MCFFVCNILTFFWALKRKKRSIFIVFHRFYIFCPAQVGPAQVGPAQVGPAQVGPAQVGPAQVGPAQVGIAQVGPAQVGTNTAVITA